MPIQFLCFISTQTHGHLIFSQHAAYDLNTPTAMRPKHNAKLIKALKAFH